ncbi:DEAD/DEAH box helicase [Vibrio coralliirubri]|uniref:DEAD/DEAH box helicase n=1 Tax=Vibrio coralliirubri TaxID=1516159 RepID=UPI002284BD9F|nr:DEAD/DEAH box helicase [Vibrio coralliirubri]MCY9866137.1 DEAD/DEAH box helicase [Vibrio coralliirubri]
MDRIEIDTDYGLLTLKYKYNLWKKKRLDPLRLLWNPTKEQYETSVSRAKEVIQHIKAVGAYVQLTPHVQDIVGLDQFGCSESENVVDLEHWQDHISFSAEPTEDFDVEEIGFNDNFTPFGYQLAGIELAKKKHGRILIADDMGLGKTLQACGVIGLFRKDLPAVIIAPKSVLHNWKTELLRFLDFIDEDDICILDNSSKKPEQLISICTYRYAVTHTDELKEYLNVNGIVISDEAHTAKETDTQVGSALIDLAHFAKRYIPLTGTPILNFVKELYSQLHALDPVRWNNYTEFTERYCEGHWTKIRVRGIEKSVWWDNGASNLEELMSIIRDDYMVRRLKPHVLSQLPEKHRSTLTLNITSHDAAFDEFMDDLKEAARPILLKNKFSVTKSADEIRRVIGLSNDELSDEEMEAMDHEGRRQKDVIFKLYEESGLAKVNEVADSIADMLENDPKNKFILFFQHRSVLNSLKAVLSERYPEYSDIVIHGDVSSAKRESEKLKYQSDENCKFAYLTIGAGYAGITLTAGNIVGMVQQPWSPRVAVQCEDRAHRIGQKSKVMVVYFLSANKFDTAQHSMLYRKSDTSTTVLDGARGERFQTNQEAANDAFNSTDAFVALLGVISEEIQEEMNLAA